MHGQRQQPPEGWGECRVVGRRRLCSVPASLWSRLCPAPIQPTLVTPSWLWRYNYFINCGRLSWKFCWRRAAYLVYGPNKRRRSMAIQFEIVTCVMSYSVQGEKYLLDKVHTRNFTRLVTLIIRCQASLEAAVERQPTASCDRGIPVDEPPHSCS